MPVYAEAPAKVPAISRTWDAHTIDRECGVVVSVRTYRVTLSRQTGEMIATVDGKQVPVLEADRILKGAALTLVSEIIPTPSYLLELAQGVAA
ncbi:hypothetical protein [Deinococcus marmoris]|uniref:Uncharacterized protein n=1 Tax=Deinococcus marmoris TaxID=249408 RepID=A0A1U7P4Y6_9DEIO|nr:hypothetical protein [Deinococcus marmoris]OLV20231.1 hypothetical protein BOO71_0000721 [Deinococcus marmoris]